MIKEKKAFINAVRQHPEVRQAAEGYINALNKHISGLEMEIFHRDIRIAELLNDISLHVDVLQSYGVDLGRIGSLPIYSLLSQVQSGETGTYTIPEKLRKHDRRKRA